MIDRTYCYEGTNVLRNKLDIKDQEELLKAERKYSAIRTKQLLENPIKGNFGLKHLQDIHAYIFQDLYEWAGELRTVDIAKGNMFCNVLFLNSQADEIFSELIRESLLQNLSIEDFAKRSAYYFSEINALHPFREGNGRSQREFIRQLAKESGYTITFDGISQDEMIEASKNAFLTDYSLMEDIFLKIVK